MPVFGIRTDTNLKAQKYMEIVNINLKSNSLIKNPFNGGIKRIGQRSDRDGLLKDYYAIVMHPIYPKFFYFGYVLAFIPFMLYEWHLNYWMIPGLLIGLLGFFYSKYFSYMMLKLGLRKARYKGKVDLIPLYKIVEIFINYIEM